MRTSRTLLASSGVSPEARQRPTRVESSRSGPKPVAKDAGRAKSSPGPRRAGDQIPQPPSRIRDLGTNLTSTPATAPASERQSRPLFPLGDDEQPVAAAWMDAVQPAGGEQPTARTASSGDPRWPQCPTSRGRCSASWSSRQSPMPSSRLPRGPEAFGPACSTWNHLP